MACWFFLGKDQKTTVQGGMTVAQQMPQLFPEGGGIHKT